MRNLNKFYIGGDWILPSSNRGFPVLNPASAAQIGMIMLANENDVNAAVEAGGRVIELISVMFLRADVLLFDISWICLVF